MPDLSVAHIMAPLAANARAHPLDVLRVKSALAALGHYDAPKWGVTPYPDAALYAAIEAFQRARGLRVDGRMKPGGETEAALGQSLTPPYGDSALRAMARAVRDMGRGGDTILAHITPGEARLLDAVTDGGSINPHTGLPEFKFGGGGSYRGHVRSDTLGRDGFDASADAKQQQAGANDFFRDGENARGAGGQGAQDLNADNLDSTRTAADEFQSTVSADPAAQRTRHAYRAGFLGSVRQSFADGLLSGKEADQDYSRGPAARGHGQAASIRTQQADREAERRKSLQNFRQIDQMVMDGIGEALQTIAQKMSVRPLRGSPISRLPARSPTDFLEGPISLRNPPMPTREMRNNLYNSAVRGNGWPTNPKIRHNNRGWPDGMGIDDILR